MEDITQHKRHSVALTARVTARGFNHKVHAMSFPYTTAWGHWIWTLRAFPSEAISNRHTNVMSTGNVWLLLIDGQPFPPRSVFPMLRGGTETNRQCFADIYKNRQSQFGSKSRIYCRIDALKTINTAQRHLDNKHRQLILPIWTRFIANLTLQTLADICKALPISLCAAP